MQRYVVVVVAVVVEAFLPRISSEPMLEVKMTMVLRKFTTLPLESVNLPSSNSYKGVIMKEMKCEMMNEMEGEMDMKEEDGHECTGSVKGGGVPGEGY